MFFEKYSFNFKPIPKSFSAIPTPKIKIPRIKLIKNTVYDLEKKIVIKSVIELSKKEKKALIFIKGSDETTKRAPITKGNDVLSSIKKNIRTTRIIETKKEINNLLVSNLFWMSLIVGSNSGLIFSYFKDKFTVSNRFVAKKKNNKTHPTTNAKLPLIKPIYKIRINSL